MKLLKKIGIGFMTTILALMLIFNLYNLIMLKVLHHDLAPIGGYALLEVVSGSMEPTIKKGDLIVINTKAQNYAKDDIVTFYDVNGSFVTHRLVELKNKVMITKGDANNSVDEELPSKNIVGKYVFKLSGFGKVISAFKSPLVSILILVIGILICYLISTDKNGEVIPDQDEKAFRKYMQKKMKAENNQPSKLTELKNKIFKKAQVEKKKKKKVKRKKKPKNNGKNKKKRK